MEKDKLGNDLKMLVDEHYTTSQFERWFYTTDIMHIPGMIKLLINTMPAAIVKPQNTGQVSAVVKYCFQNSIAVVPRGGGSSGLFGAVPKKGGIVIDLMDLSKIENIDTDKEQVTAQAGITWWQLEKALEKQDLSLRSYPSSARSATLGGWIMTSGLGIGSLQYGAVFEQVVSAEVVLPDGTVHRYSTGKGLEQFFETEGVLGIITKITLKVRKKPEIVSPHLVYFENINDLFEATRYLVKTKPAPYNMEFFDDKYLSMLKKAGYNAVLPSQKSGSLLVTYDGSKQNIEQGSENINKACAQFKGRELEGADEEWQHRFNMLRVKRAVPSLAPSSAYVPLERMEQFYAGIGKLTKREIAVVGYIVSDSKCNFMPLMATDDNHILEYVFSLHTPRELSNLALSLGGKPGGGVGIWNAPYKSEILGKKRLDSIKLFKKEIDSRNIMNPGMWLEPPVLFKPNIYQLAMGAASLIDKILPAKIGKVKNEGFEKELAACVQCGYCMDVCPTNQGWLSSTPRGRVLMTRELFLGHPHGHKDMAQEYLERIYQCTACGRCGVDCSVDIKSRPMWMGVRDYLNKNGFELESLKGMNTTICETHNMSGKDNEQRANWLKRVKLPYDLNEKKTAEVVYFTGCVASFFPMVQGSARSFVQILDAAGTDFTIVGGEEWCCGFPLMVAGYNESAEKCVLHNIERIRDMGAKTIVMTCPGCYKVWKDEYKDITSQRHPFEVMHSAEYLARLIEEGKLDIKGFEETVTYHDPCDLGRNSGIYDEPRFIINSIPGLKMIELENNREYCTCCGSGGDLLATNQQLSLDIANRKLQEILDTGAQTVATACPSCIRAITMTKTTNKAKLNVMDISELLWKALQK